MKYRSGYRLVPTTADVGIEAYGEGLPELAQTAAQALFALLAEAEFVSPSGKINVKAVGHDWGGLLVNWLNEIIFLHETREMLFNRVEVTNWGEFYLEGRLLGEPIDADRHQLRYQVKGVTYHCLEVTESPDGWRLRAIVDI